MSATSEHPQRRDAYRLAAQLHVRVFRPRTQIGALVDLSVTGALFGFDLPCADGDTVTFALVTPEGDRLRLSGVVVRRDGGHTAVKLQNLSAANERALSSMVATLQREMLREISSTRR